MKYVAIFLRKIGEYENKNKVKRPNFVKVGEKRFSSLDETIVFEKDNSFPVQLEAFSYQNKDTLFYFYDYDDMSLIGLETLLKYNMKPKDLNKVTGKRIVEQIVAGAKSVQGNPLIYIIIPIICIFVGLLLGYWMGGGFNSATPTT
jgi:hypothetical protein